jgi:uncharacterized repeat protein (TIGR03847 family)
MVGIGTDTVAIREAATIGSMARRLYIFDAPDRFVAGTVGQPGQRAFFLQARKGSSVVTVGLEKVQVEALSERLGDLLEAVEAPVIDPPDDAVRLEEPVVEAFRVGAMALAWDASDESVVIEAQTPTEDGEYAELPDDELEGPDLLRVRLPAADARGFAQQASALVGAGRPPCPFCGEPLDPQGHFCTRSSSQPN